MNVVTHAMLLLVTDLDGLRREHTLATASHPSTWSAATTRAFLHDVQRTIGAHGIYRISFDPGIPGPLCALMIVAGSAMATVTLPGLSAAGRIELERRTFELPWRRPQEGWD